MYVPPQLIRVGDAREVVLGTIDLGFDLDGSKLISDLEGAPEYPFPGGKQQ
jgi:hypothetical protein